jgi:hypothetical protein
MPRQKICTSGNSWVLSFSMVHEIAFMSVSMIVILAVGAWYKHAT